MSAEELIKRITNPRLVALFLTIYILSFVILRTISKTATARDGVTTRDVTIYSYILHRQKQANHNSGELPDAQNPMLYSMEKLLFYAYYPCMKTDFMLCCRMHYFDYESYSRKEPGRYQ